MWRDFARRPDGLRERGLNDVLDKVEPSHAERPGEYGAPAELVVKQRILHREAVRSCVAGQFADLEEPTDAITIDAARSPEQIVAEIRKRLALS